MASRLARAAALGFLFLIPASEGRAESSPPPASEDVGVVERLGEPVPLDLVFRDGKDRSVRLSEIIRGDKPVLLVIAYYRCPMLCGLVLRGVAMTLGKLSWVAGQEYRIVTISFDPDERGAQAKERQEAVVAMSEGAVDAERWPFWTGGQESISRLLLALGVKVVRDPATGQFAHPAVSFVLTPEGHVSRYVYGIDPKPLDLRLALIEASKGRTGTTADRVLLRCFQYDPATRRYGIFLTRYFRVGGAALLGGLIYAVIRLLRSERRRLSAAESEVAP